MSSEFGGNRFSSFFVHVAASNLNGGGTNFPVLAAMLDEKWCEYVDCDESWENGVIFKPILTNAVFWQNLNENEVGDERTTYAGLPVISGEKLGMNIWNRQGPVGKRYRGDEEFED